MIEELEFIEQLEDFKNQDPIDKVLSTIKTNKLATDKEIEKIIQKVKDVIDESVKFAEDSPEPEAKELYEDVYVGDYPYIIEHKD